MVSYKNQYSQQPNKRTGWNNRVGLYFSKNSMIECTSVDRVLAHASTRSRVSLFWHFLTLVCTHTWLINETWAGWVNLIPNSLETRLCITWVFFTNTIDVFQVVKGCLGCVYKMFSLFSDSLSCHRYCQIFDFCSTWLLTSTKLGFCRCIKITMLFQKYLTSTRNSVEMKP